MKGFSQKVKSAATEELHPYLFSQKTWKPKPSDFNPTHELQEPTFLKIKWLLILASVNGVFPVQNIWAAKTIAETSGTKCSAIFVYR